MTSTFNKTNSSLYTLYDCYERDCESFIIVLFNLKRLLDFAKSRVSSYS